MTQEEYNLLDTGSAHCLGKQNERAKNASPHRPPDGLQRAHERATPSSIPMRKLSTKR